MRVFLCFLLCVARGLDVNLANIGRFFRSPVETKPVSELDALLDAPELKPWRASKPQYLKVEYRPSKDSWKERYHLPGEDTVHLYSIPSVKNAWDRTRVEDIWFWPWLWTKPKADRLGWIHKYFTADVDALSVQEHIELDAFFSEFDMPLRWTLLKFLEADLFFAASLNLAFFTALNGIKPTDLGLRPDGSLHTCPVEIHNCISSSNNPANDHYAPPFKWSRSKSPDQALEEVKNTYFNYPKKGLKWSSDWIDRGGYRPIEFGGSYFYSQTDSLLYKFTDDIELVINSEKREVSYRSSGRVGFYDWDTQRSRYNQFARMLAANGGWEAPEIQREEWLVKLPYHWTEAMLDGVAANFEKALAGSTEEGTYKTFIDGVRGVLDTIDPYFKPILTGADNIITDPRVAAAIQELSDFLNKVTSSVMSITSQEDIRALTDKINELLGVEEGDVDQAVDSVLSFLKAPLTKPAEDTDTIEPPGTMDSSQISTAETDGKAWRRPRPTELIADTPASSSMRRGDISGEIVDKSTAVPPASSPIEWIVEDSASTKVLSQSVYPPRGNDETGVGGATSISQKRAELTDGERRILQSRIQQLKNNFDALATH